MAKARAGSAAKGQLVWCPADPALGIGVVTEISGSRVHVHFERLQAARIYTTRTAEEVIARYEIRPGERVRHRDGRRLQVVQVHDLSAGLTTYELDDGSEAVESDLVPDVRDVGAKERLASLALVHPEVVRARMQGLTLSAMESRPGVAAVLGCRALWLPHQIDVATQAIERDPVRMLLADEVGLGKTVEAALIYAGLRYEGRADRILILTPGALTIQWLGEIYRKAHELLVLLDDERIDDARQDFPELSPFDAYQRIVASIDRIAADPVLAGEAISADWDLVVVDEAHHLRWRPEGGGNAGYRLLERLAQKTRHLLLLTATPMALDPAEYHALLRLLDPARFDDPHAFESIRSRVTSIRDVARSLQDAVEGEAELPEDTKRLAQDVLSDDEEDVRRLETFVEQGPQGAARRAAAAAVLDALRERHGLASFVVRNRRGPVGGLPERCHQIFPLEPTEAQDKLIDVGEAVMFELANTIDDQRDRYQTLGGLLRALWATPRALTDILAPLSPALVQELAPHISRVIDAPIDLEGLPTGDARLRWLVRLVMRLEEPDKLLVFVESAIAVRALKDALETILGGNVAVFHRGLAPRDQDRQVAWFRDPQGPRVMLSTEAGGEGRNFQFCHKVVLYDMPWRPATVEQRIGRVDRVGQTRDVHVLVPYFKSGYEAAILKVMQESIGVLDHTVGGIDYALEFVSDRLAELILSGADVDAWKALYQDTATLVTETRTRIAAAVDPILDHASYSPQRVAEIIERVPKDTEAKTTAFVRGYADHSRLELHAKGSQVFAVEGAPSASGGSGADAVYAATFERTHALDHEDVDFLSIGHPLVEQALDWAREAHEASAALAICRGFGDDGAVFIWRFGLDLPSDVREAAAYFDEQLFTIALDESGRPYPELLELLEAERPLDRMDPAPLHKSLDRWRRLVNQNYADAEKLADRNTQSAIQAALGRLKRSMARRERDLVRQHRRELSRARARPEDREALGHAHDGAKEELAGEKARIATAIEHVRPRLIAAVAVRLVKAKTVSG